MGYYSTGERRWAVARAEGRCRADFRRGDGREEHAGIPPVGRIVNRHYYRYCLLDRLAVEWDDRSIISDENWECSLVVHPSKQIRRSGHTQYLALHR